MNMDTLRTISIGLGLHPNTLHVLRSRHADFPKPAATIGPTGGTMLFAIDEVEAWYVARHMDEYKEAAST